MREEDATCENILADIEEDTPEAVASSSASIPGGGIDDESTQSQEAAGQCHNLQELSIVSDV